MTFYSLFAPSIAALNANSLAFQTIGENVTNVNTAGFKQAETRFKDVMHLAGASNPVNAAQQQYGGMIPHNQFFIDRQGVVSNTGRNLDVAISGKGFFVTNKSADGSGAIEFTRAGEFNLRTINGGTANEETYIVDSSGNFLQGWLADDTGAFTTSTDISSLDSIRVDSNSSTFQANATTTATLRANLDAEAAVGSTYQVGISAYDSAGNDHVVQFTLQKAGPNSWTMIDPPTMPAGDGTASIGGNQTLTFDADGNLVTPANIALNLTITSPAADSASVAVDISDFTQYAGANTIRGATRNGNAAGTLSTFRVLESGVVEGVFSNGLTRPIAKLPLAVVDSPNLMNVLSDTHYSLSDLSGGVTLYEADQTGQGSFVPNAVEGSNVDLANEFTKLITTQQAYNSSARVITTVDEMVRTATDLKG